MVILPERFREQLEAILCDWQRRLTPCLQLARENGQLAADAACEELVAFFWIGWEGAVQRARLVRNGAPLDIFLEGFLAGLPH